MMTGGPTVSSDGMNFDTAVVWAVTSNGNSNQTLQAGALRAYAAQDLSQELYSSEADSADELGFFTKFAPPVVVNSRVYVPTHSGSVSVYGLLCQQDASSGTSIAASTITQSGKGKKGTTLSQSFEVTNTGNGALAGPFRLALDGLPGGLTVVNQAGVTGCAAPLGSPYLEPNSQPLWLQPGQSISFTAKYSGSAGPGTNPTPRLLAGSGER
jgi:hypothetical protein